MEQKEERVSLLQMVDDLIYHVNAERAWFQMLVITSLIIAPISLFLTFFFLTNPRILISFFRFGGRILGGPIFGPLMFSYIIVNLIVASLWLVVGIREFRFFRKPYFNW